MHSHCMNEELHALPYHPAATPLPLRESLSVLVLSTGILRRHGSSLHEEDRVAQRHMMQEAAAHLAAALAAEGAEAAKKALHR